MFRNRLFQPMAVLIGAFWFGSASPASAAPPPRPPVMVNRPALPNPMPPHPNRMPGWDWWRTYPWSPYNAWRNPYWYDPYTPYVAPYCGGVAPSSNYYQNYYDPSLPPVPGLPSLPPIN